MLPNSIKCVQFQPISKKSWVKIIYSKKIAVLTNLFHPGSFSVHKKQKTQIWSHINYYNSMVKVKKLKFIMENPNH